MNRFACAAPITLALLASACSTVDTSKIRPDSGANATGIAYFLPRQLARVSAKRSEVSLDKSITALAQAELALSAAKAGAAAAEAAVKETEDALVEKGDVPAIRDLLLARLATQKKALADAQAEVPKKEAARATAAANLTGAVNSNAGKRPGDDTKPKQYDVVVNIELLPPTADPAFGYRMTPRHSAFRDDEHKLAVSAGGLLTSADIVASDRTADALVEIATFAGAIAGAEREAEVGKPALEATCPAHVPEQLTQIVDFASVKDVNRLNDSLACMGARVRVVSRPPTFAEAQPAPGHGNVFDGIVYRTPIELLVQVEKCPRETANCSVDGDWFPAITLALSLPQAGPISYIPQNAGFMTRTTYGTAFKDGILVSYNSSRPSEVLEVARTPMRLVQGFFDGFSKVISLRTGQNNAQAGLVNSQLAVQQAESGLLVDALTGRKKLTDQQLELLKSDIALRSAQLGGPAQLSSADLAATETLLQNQARRDAINKCIGDKVTAGQPIDPCLAKP
jgi:hypothetical protein